MKVLQLTHARHQPGRLTANRFVDEEIRSLMDRGVEVHLLSEAVDAEEVLDGVRLHPIRGGKREIATCLARNAFRLPLRLVRAKWDSASRALQIEKAAADLVAREGIDLIHSHWGWPTGFGGELAASLSRRPLVATFRGADVNLAPELGYGTRSEPLVDAMMRRLARRADRITCYSDFMRRNIVQLGGRPGRITVTRKGVDLERFSPRADRPAAKRALGLDGPVVLNVASLTPVKGVDLVIRAFASVPVPATLLVVGQGGEEERLRALAGELGVGERVRFLGHVAWEEMPTLYAAGDVFALFSRYEAAGNVVLEAMACGRPVVSIAGSGPAEYITQGETGFTAPPEDVDALAAHLRWMLDHPDAAEEMGRRGRAVAEREFSYDRMIDRIATVYEDACARQERANP